VGAARLLLLLAVGLAAAACGEDVDFTSTPLDAGTVDALATPRDGPPPAPDATADALSDGALATPDSGCPAGFNGGAGLCHPNGSLCRSTKDCCSNRCEQGYCLPSGACQAPGAACTARGTCCSERCEPSGRSGALTCTQFCQADGTPCDSPSDCCSLGCNGGMCGGALCTTSGQPCGVDSQCCSARCAGGRCAPEPAACLPTGEGCDADGGGMACCTGFCNRTGRCDLGSGACREASSPCNGDFDCCLGKCMPDAQGISVCTAACRAEGEDCNSSGDCCEPLSCNGSPLRCVALPPGCP
jgi:hypothetical protein